MAAIIVDFDTQEKAALAGNIPKDNCYEARNLLTRIDELSEANVDALLWQAMAEGDSE